MKKLLIIILIILILSSLAFAKLSDETQELVEDLRWKHYGYRSGELLFCRDCTISGTAITWNRSFLNIWVEDGKLFVETQDGTWFIEMKEVKE